MSKPLDLMNKRFGNMQVVGKRTEVRFYASAKKKRRSEVVWKCLCDCGKEFEVITSRITRYNVTCCRTCTDKTRVKNLSGKVYGRLHVLELVPERKHGGSVWKCLCECGNIAEVKGGSLQSGTTKSCGCLQQERKAIFRTMKTLKYGLATFRRVLRNYENGAKDRNIAFEISEEELWNITQQPCFYCGVEPKQVSYNENKKDSFTYNGIDRYDNDKGYISGNCVPCCRTCNRAKLDLSVDDFYAWIGRIISHNIQKTIQYNAKESENLE